MTNILPGERIDDLQCKGYRLIQKPEGFCFGMDAVLLAHYTRVPKDAKVLDMCSGSGVIPILLAGISIGSHFTGLELQEAYSGMACRSIELNNLQDRVSMIQGDVKEAAGLFPSASFDVVTTNPPYINEKHGLTNPHEPKNIARHEIYLCLEDVIKAGAYVLREGGIFTMIHKPFRLPEIISLMKKYRLEPKRMRLVQPYVNKEPNMVLIEGVKGGNPMIKIDPALIVYKDVNVYTDEIYEIYGKSEGR